jgi:hypothetical protein
MLVVYNKNMTFRKNSDSSNNKSYSTPEIDTPTPENQNGTKILKPKKINYNKLYNDLQDKICQKKQPRKFHFDSMLKKLKSKTFKSIHTCIRTCLKENFILKRIPQTFITDIKIESNKKFFKKTVKEIYEDFHIKFELNSEDVKSEKSEVLKNFLSCTFSEIYEFYKNSKQFIRDKNDLIKKHNVNFGVLYEFLSQYYLQYFNSSKGNNIKRRRNIKKINFKVISSEQINNLKGN